MVLVVIDFIAAIPVFVFDRCTFLPVFVLDVRVVVVVVLGESDATRKFFIKYSFLSRMLERQVASFALIEQVRLTGGVDANREFDGGLSRTSKELSERQLPRKRP
jgi:hypothetical protein